MLGKAAFIFIILLINLLHIRFFGGWISTL